MDPEAVFVGLRDRAKTITGLRAFEFAPDSIPEPCFFPAELDIDYDQAMAGGVEQYLVTCRLLTSRADDRSGQKKLKAFLARTGAKSVRAALMADRTLGGACDSLHVQKATGYGLYEHAGTHYYGAEWSVLIIGRGV